MVNIYTRSRIEKTQTEHLHIDRIIESTCPIFNFAARIDNMCEDHIRLKQKLVNLPWCMSNYLHFMHEAGKNARGWSKGLEPSCEERMKER